MTRKIQDGGAKWHHKMPSISPRKESDRLASKGIIVSKCPSTTIMFWHIFGKMYDTKNLRWGSLVLNVTITKNNMHPILSCKESYRLSSVSVSKCPSTKMKTQRRGSLLP